VDKKKFTHDKNPVSGGWFQSTTPGRYFGQYIWIDAAARMGNWCRFICKGIL